MSTPRRSPLRRWTARFTVFAAAMVTLSACTTDEFLRQAMPLPATEQAERILSLWQGSWIAAWGLGALVWGLIIWSAIFHRKKYNHLPAQVRYNMPIEALYTVIPIIVVAVFFYFTARDEAKIVDISKKPDVLVDVVAFQWSWKFYYENDGMHGRQPEDGVHVIGRAGQRPTLVLPKGKRVQFNLYSQDVAHSFWVPAFLFKRDVLPYKDPPPGKEFWQMPKNQKPYWNNKFQVVPTREGTFAGRCAELCGANHSKMLFRVKVVSWPEYKQFINKTAAEQATEGGS